MPWNEEREERKTAAGHQKTKVEWENRAKLSPDSLENLSPDSLEENLLVIRGKNLPYNWFACLLLLLVDSFVLLRLLIGWFSSEKGLAVDFVICKSSSYIM